MNFGRSAPTETAFDIMDAAHAAGINYFDTANTYSAPDEPSISERIIGDWFDQGGGRRERTILATKLFESTDPWPNNEGLSALNIRRACDASLARLKTDYIDVLQMHHVDRGSRWDEVWEAFEVLRAQGKILYAGSSNFAGWHLAVAQQAARSRNHLGLVSEQSVYNLAERSIELEVLPAAEHFGIGVVIYSPLGGGLFARESTVGARAGSPEVLALREQHREQLDATAAIARDLGVTVPQVAIAWLLTRPAVVAPIVGPRTLEQLNSLIPAASLRFDATVLDDLDRIWPGPGPAPEAYAW
jgi:NDP-hexose 2,3-enoyl reductase